MRLLNLLRKKPFCNDFHFLLIPILLFLISLKYWPFYIVLGIYLIYLFKKTKLIIPSLVFILLFSIEILIHYFISNVTIPNNIDTYVSDIVNEDTYICYYKGIKIRVKEYDHKNEPGDYINLSISINEINDKSYSNDFDYKEYLKSNGIFFDSKGKTIKKYKNFYSLYKIKYYYKNYLKKHLSVDSYNYVSAVVFGDNTLEDSIKDTYSILGISHILAISGLHILFLFKIISFILLKVFNYYKKLIPISIIILYALLIGAPPSAIRATLFLLIGTLNKKGEVSYTRLDILSISMILMLILNPYQIYNTGFLLSYLVSFILIYKSKDKSILKGAYKSYLLIYFSTFPIVINMTNRISIISLILSPIFSLIIGFIIMPISYILAIVPILDYVFKYIFIGLNSYLEGISSYALFINVPSINIYIMVIYYVFFIILILFISKKKNIIAPLAVLSSFLVLIINLRFLNPFYKITYLDCGQGDSAIIELPNNKGLMVIDAYNSFDYLKSLGISKIDILLFTHSDSDHIGDYKEIIDYFDVKKIIYPLYDTRFKELMDYKLDAVISGDYFNFGNIKIDILAPINNYEDPNSNSIVLSFKIDNIKYLFTGDMTEKEEKDVIEKYGNTIDSDILKVAHHGSNTSSSIDFINRVSPSYSIISVAKKNSYNLPNKEIVARLESISKVYITYMKGNITILEYKGKVSIRTYR